MDRDKWGRNRGSMALDGSAVQRSRNLRLVPQTPPMTRTILNGLVAWYFSSPTVLEFLLIYAMPVAIVMAIVGYARRE